MLTGATYPSDEVATERDRLVDRIQVAQSQPAHLARVALLKRMYGEHPYAVQTPDADAVRAVGPAELRALHAERVHPAGATLVLVGDIDPEQALDAGRGGARRRGTAPGRPVELPPDAAAASPGRCCWSTGPARCSPRCGWRCRRWPRTHPDHAALQLANLVFGGYFSSRWVENIREDKGYTYGPHSSIEHSVAGSALVVVGRGGHRGDRARRCWRPRTSWAGSPRCRRGEDELEQARQYALGTLQLGMSTQAGLAGLASTYAGFGLRLDFLAEHAARLAAATRDDVAAAAARYLAPAKAVDRGARRRRAGSTAPLAALTTVDECARRSRPGDRPAPPSGGAAAGPLHTGPGGAAAYRRRLAGRGVAAGQVLVIAERQGAGRAADAAWCCCRPGRGARGRAALPRRRPGRHAVLRRGRAAAADRADALARPVGLREVGHILLATATPGCS